VGVLFAAFFVLFAVSEWRQIVDLRAHGVEVTGKVVRVVHGKNRKAWLELPTPDGGTAEAEIGVRPLTKVSEGNLIEVTYDPADLDMVQRGWGIDYATPVWSAWAPPPSPWRPPSGCDPPPPAVLCRSAGPAGGR
jgi:hypothetical protein